MLSDNDTLKLYMQHIAQYPLVTPAEESDLAKGIHQGSEACRTRLIRSNLRLVVKIAHDFKGRGLPLLDLISEGNIGLMVAVGKFDPSKGAKLSSYAAWWIKQSMRRALANQARTIRIPVQSATKISKIQDARSRLRERLDRDPTDAEVAVVVNLTERTVCGLGRVRTTTVSLSAPVQDGEDGELRDIIPDDGAPAPDRIIQEHEMIRHMLELVDNLDERERRIINLRYGLGGTRPHTLEEISQIVGRTRERIRQIQNRALHQLRAMLESDTLQSVSAAA
ncbi:MAG: hypothetical protein A3K18_30395 [Lentisphaerae bacterium RIFOXYA12_64_32]|nr:MAG: hypothetical protein A3K18_30395 [Lentisphaerae bacterium RIFOXYA12_64_32]